MSGWIRVNSDPVTGPVNTSAQKEKKEHVSPSVSWKGWRAPPASEYLGKVAKMQIRCSVSESLQRDPGLRICNKLALRGSDTPFSLSPMHQVIFLNETML